MRRWTSASIFVRWREHFRGTANMLAGYTYQQPEKKMKMQDGYGLKPVKTLVRWQRSKYVWFMDGQPMSSSGMCRKFIAVDPSPKQPILILGIPCWIASWVQTSHKKARSAIDLHQKQNPEPADAQSEPRATIHRVIQIHISMIIARIPTLAGWNSKIMLLKINSVCTYPLVMTNIAIENGNLYIYL